MDGDKWKREGSIAIPTTGATDLLSSLDVFDQYVFDCMQSGSCKEDLYGQGAYNEDKIDTGYFGQFYISDLKPLELYQTVLLLNSTSQTAVGAWGAYAHEAILKQYLNDYAKDNDPTGDKKIKPAGTWNMTITDVPFPLAQLFQAITKASAGTTSAILMTIAWMMMSDALV